MATLFVDAGNTNVKWRSGETGEIHRCAFDSAEFHDWVKTNRNLIAAVAVSSVQNADWNQKLVSLCNELGLELWFSQAEAASQGLSSAYSQPENLGVDRWLALLALWCRLKRGFLLVDSGTALTLDIVDDKGQHQGGYILPGFDLQRSSLLDRSEKLNDLVDSFPDYQVGLGSNTEEAIDRGILASIAALTQQLVRDHEIPTDRLIFTGGNAGKLCEVLGLGEIEADLVLAGLSIAWQSLPK